MPQPPSSYSWLSFPLYAPLSGAVNQDITTTLVNGDWQTEAEIFRKEGLGRQIGIVSDALTALIAVVAASPDARTLMGAARTQSGKNPFEELGKLVERVDAIKASNRVSAQQTAEAAVERAARLNPGGVADLEARLNAARTD